mgnify:CR=1 FL=1
MPLLTPCVAGRLSLLCMYRYFIKTPSWVRLLFPRYLWRVATERKEVYLTFDDGPHPQITPWVLEELDKYKAKATFFCVGNNVATYNAVYQRILFEGHAVGNHTHTHKNGWKTDADTYLKDVAEAAAYIDSALFRPPYGKISRRQAKGMAGAMSKQNARIVMWDVLSADFDQSISSEKCLQNVLKNTTAGSVIVFHDSEKAAAHLQFALPKVLKYLSRKGYRFARLEGEGA